MVELVDTLASGASGGNPVEVRVLFAVPKYGRPFGRPYFVCSERARYPRFADD